MFKILEGFSNVALNEFSESNKRQKRAFTLSGEAPLLNQKLFVNAEDHPRLRWR